MPYKDPNKRKEASRKSSAKWTENNREQANTNARNWRRRNQLHMLRLAAKKRADRDGIEFDLSLEDMPEIPGTCPILGIPLFQRPEIKRGPCDNSPTLDRRDTIRGYTKDNVAIISHKANRWKSNMTREDIQKITDYMDGKL